MKKQTKNILTKLALVAAPFVIAATITTSAVSANADGTSFGDWNMTPAEQANMEKANELTNQARERDHSTQAESEAQGAAFQKQQDAEFKARVARNEREFGGDNSQSTATPARKHVAKKTTKKKAVKKHARHLFRIKVKTNKVYAYKTIKLHKAGRKLEKKGSKLYVYGIVKKGHKTYYKIAGGRVITSGNKYVIKIAK